MGKTTPPVASRRPHQFEYHGVTVTDPYAWLKDPHYPTVEDQDVLDYLQQENKYFEAFMAPLQPLVETLFTELKARQVEEDESVPYEKNGWRYQWRYKKDAQYRTWYRAPAGTPEAWQVLLDETELARDHEYFRLGSLAVSPGGHRLAYSTDTSGSERYTLTVIDLTDGETLVTGIENASGSAIWGSDDDFLYTRLSEEWRPYQVWHHQLGRADDQLIYEEADTSFFVGIELTQSEKYVLISAGGHTHNEVYFVPRAGLTAAPTLITPRRDNHEYDVDHGEDQFYIRSNRDHINFDLFTAPEDAPGIEHWQKLISGSDDVYLTDHLKLKDHLVVQERHRGLDQIRIVSGDTEHLIPFDEPAYEADLGTNPNYDTDVLRLNYTSMVTPNTVFDY
ncbi:MAG: hypothetical protein RIC89_14830, partial [Pseudomonadales bacterium]